MCFLLGEFSHLTPTTNTAFRHSPNQQNDHESQNPTSPDSFSVQGILDSGAAVSFHMFLMTAEAPSSVSWAITGEKGSLKFEGSNINIQMIPPTLYQHQGGGSKMNWEKVEVPAPMAFGGVGELYEAIALGEKVEGCLVNFEMVALRHRMLDACARSAKDGTRETYRK
jgi:predicted dehydrogenase